MWKIVGLVRQLHITPEEFENGDLSVKTHQMFSVHTAQKNLKTEISFWKHMKCFPSTLHRRNLKTEISLRKPIKCLPFTLHRSNLKTEISLWKHIKCFPSTLHRRNLKTEISLRKPVKCLPFTLHRSNLKTEISLWKHIKCFPFTLHRSNLKTEISFWKHIKCFPSTLHRGNLKTANSLWKHIKCFLSTPHQRNFKQRFLSENTSNVFCPMFSVYAYWRHRVGDVTVGCPTCGGARGCTGNLVPRTFSLAWGHGGKLASAGHVPTLHPEILASLHNQKYQNQDVEETVCALWFGSAF